MRVRTLNQVTNDWVAQALLCYDMHPASDARRKKLRDTAKGRALTAFKNGTAPADIRAELFGFVEEQYVTFQSKAKRMAKAPDRMSTRKYGARKITHAN